MKDKPFKLYISSETVHEADLEETNKYKSWLSAVFSDKYNLLGLTYKDYNITNFYEIYILKKYIESQIPFRTVVISEEIYNKFTQYINKLGITNILNINLDEYKNVYGMRLYFKYHGHGIASIVLINEQLDDNGVMYITIINGINTVITGTYKNNTITLYENILLVNDLNMWLKSTFNIISDEIIKLLREAGIPNGNK